jgi:hypothetical protein
MLAGKKIDRAVADLTKSPPPRHGGDTVLWSITDHENPGAVMAKTQIQQKSGAGASWC